MRCVGLVVGLAAFPAVAQTADQRQDLRCKTLWDAAISKPDIVPLTGTYHGVTDGWCRFTDIGFVTQGVAPNIEIDEVRVRGLPFYDLLFNSPLSDPWFRQDVQITGLRMIPQIGDPQWDWLYRAQARAFGISAELSLNWEVASKVLNLNRLFIDFPGDNSVLLTAKVAQVNVTSVAALEMSATSFAVTEARLDVTTHGMFETYVLLALGGLVLPDEDNMDAAVEGLRADALGGIAALPDAAFPAGTKDALLRLMGELPNPAGRLTVDFAATPGLGPSRLTGFALTGMPTTVAEAANLFQGVKVDASWTHEDAE